MTRTSDGRWIRRFFGGLLAIIGCFDVIGSLTAHHPLRSQVLESLLPADVSFGGRTGTVIAGLALLLLAFGVARGRRAAWQLTMIALVASVIFHVVKDLDIEEAALAAWVAGGLWWMRRHFRAASDVASMRRGVAILFAGVLLAAAYGIAGVWLLRTELRPGFELPRAVLNLVRSLAQQSAAYDALTDRAAWFLGSLPWIAYGLVMLGLLLLLRPVVAPAAGAAERERLRAVIERWGWNPISHLALDGPLSHFWIDDESCIAYRVRGTSAIALGDPIAPPDRREESVQRFVRYCDEQGWNCAFYAIAEAGPYRAQGFTLVPIGSDAIVSTAGFDLKGRRRASIRYAVRHCERLGLTFRFISGPDALASHAQQISEVSGAWLGGGKGPELGFSLGGLTTLRDPDVTVGLALDPGGVLHGFVSWLPVPARKAWTLDLMRRRPDGVPGVMEALIAASIQEAAARGIGEVSLGLAPLSLEGASGDRAYRALKDVYAGIDRFRRSRSLRHFKAKFLPEWEGRYVAVSSAPAVPEVLLALLLVHLPPTSWLALRLRALAPRRRRPQSHRWVGAG
ncbi:MAG TPA: phosphatidylglycerol lysyltransferase domain-containing protein [Candidatus Dormibacteraeota bacterium]|nr:phosphatidylglycerol lysyltransferase domain-containing protein [Candidatus Dormibacteraeota bacterium]